MMIIHNIYQLLKQCMILENQYLTMYALHRYYRTLEIKIIKFTINFFYIPPVSKMLFYDIK